MARRRLVAGGTPGWNDGDRIRISGSSSIPGRGQDCRVLGRTVLRYILSFTTFSRSSLVGAATGRNCHVRSQSLA
ncbi:MAG: hypothetical protein JWN34_6232 [Bryobacterales bacterium]|jgi:hypothetical protein|nr:hypothetical protein [Bryobacterales bacterium]